MFGNNAKKDSSSVDSAASIETFIGNGCTITGDIVSQKSIKIDGTINGNIEVAGSVVVVGRGVIKGDIKCKELVVFGSVEGMITTESLHLHETSRIVGDINTAKLNVDAGAIYQGAVNMNTKLAVDKPAADQKAKPAKEPVKLNS